MPAPSKAFTVIADTSIDPDSPLDTSLFTAIRDNGEHLKEVLYGTFTPSAPHTHNGVDSALVEIGPNLLRNGSFEQDTAGWNISTFTGGSQAINTTQEMDGAKCLAFTSTSTANGGGEAVNGEYIPITGGEGIDLKFAIKASVANVSAKAEAIWYDNAQAQISVSTLYTATSTPTSLTGILRSAGAPSNARFVRVRLTGGVPGSGSATGTVYFDGVALSKADWAEPGIYPVSTQVNGSFSGTTPTKKGEIVAPKSGIYRVWLNVFSSDGNPSSARIYKNGAAFGTSRSSVSAQYTEDLSFVKGDLVQLYVWHPSASADGNGQMLLQEAYPSGFNGLSL